MSATKINVLSLPTTLANGPGVISPTVIHDDQYAILVDAGLPNMAEAFKAALDEIGVPLPRLTHIVITHSDMDHIGSIAQLRADAPQKIEVLCHGAERKYVECDVPPIRLTQMEASLANTPEEHRPRMKALVESLKANYRLFRITVDQTVEDCDALPCGVEVITTPGHTPGHICLYVRELKTLIAGDAMNVEGGRLVSAPRFTQFDPAAYRQSMLKLTGYDIETVVCYHGGVYSENVNQRIKEIAKE